jgi:hypothetical protein
MLIASSKYDSNSRSISEEQNLTEHPQRADDGQHIAIVPEFGSFCFRVLEPCIMPVQCLKLSWEC